LIVALVVSVSVLGGARAGAIAVAELSFTKSLPPDQAVSQVGELVTYTLVVENTGWVTVTGVDIDESGFGGSGPLGRFECGYVVDRAYVVDHGLVLGRVTLRAGEGLICQVQYVATLADAHIGLVKNTAFATGAQGVFNEKVQSEPDSAVFEVSCY